MRNTGGRPPQDEVEFQGEDYFLMLERKEPGWIGSPDTDSSEKELALADSLRASGRLEKAAKRYNIIVRHWGSSCEAPVAQRAYADLLLEMEKMEDAFEQYQYLVKFYAGQFEYDDVLEQQMKIANYLMTTPTSHFLFFIAFAAPEKAIPYYEQILENGPKWKRAPEAQFNIGLISEEIDDLESAILAYDAVVNRFRSHQLAPDAAFRKAVCLMKLWRKTPRNERSLRDALSALASFAAGYPASSDSEEARDLMVNMKESLADMYFARAEFYETVKRNDKAAIIAYTEFIREFPTSKKAVAAQKRIDYLKDKQRAE
jgi:outer membrane protein assembly factor BamD (BamD/ComL family)